MLSLAVNGYTVDEIKTALHAAQRFESFRYDLLDKNGVFKKALKNVQGGRVEYNSLSEIKRSANFTINDDGGIEFLSDRIQPWFRLKMSNGTPNGEEGTTNLWTNGGWQDGTLTGWTDYTNDSANVQGTRTVKPDAKYKYILELAKTDTTAARLGVSQDKALDPIGKPMTDTIYIKNISSAAGSILRLYCDYEQADTTYIYGAGFNLNLDTMTFGAITAGTAKITDVGGGWYKIEYTTTSTTVISGNNIIWVQAAPATVQLAWTQKEAKNHATSFTAGTRKEPTSDMWAEWPLGVFILSTPPRRIDEAGAITREVEAYDLLQVLNDDKVSDRYTVTSGTNYITAIKTILDGAGIKNQNLTATTKTLPVAMDWPPGTAKIRIVNDLLGAINYRSLWFDAYGFAIAQPYVSPADRSSEYTYSDDSSSVIYPEVEQNLDTFGIPNKWVLVVSETDRAAITSTYTNANPDSPTSTYNRGRTIVDYRTGESAADQTTLDAKGQRLAFEASQIYEKVDFDTAIMPMHSDSDVLTLNFSGLDISSKYAETGWSVELKAGVAMKHHVRKVIYV